MHKPPPLIVTRPEIVGDSATNTTRESPPRPPVSRPEIADTGRIRTGGAFRRGREAV